MYDYIKGELVETNPTEAVIENNGIGYKLQISLQTFADIQTLKETKLYIYHHVREDDISLYGFLTMEELNMFELLISVSGVGAKSALSILANIEPPVFALAVITNDTSKLVKMPGVGAKTAARIVLELKDKLKNQDIVDKKQTVVKQNKSTLTLKDAKKIEAELIQELSIHKSIPSNQTLGQLFLYYKQVKASEVREATLQQNARRIERYILPYFEQKKCSSFTLNDFQQWKNEIDKLEVTTFYKNKIYKMFNELINFGIKYEYYNINLLKRLGNFKKPGEIVKNEMDFWTKEEFDKFIQYGECDCLMNENNDNEFVKWGYYVMYNIMFYCGCRKSEVYPLTWHDYKNGIISISHFAA